MQARRPGRQPALAKKKGKKTYTISPLCINKSLASGPPARMKHNTTDNVLLTLQSSHQISDDQSKQCNVNVSMVSLRPLPKNVPMKLGQQSAFLPPDKTALCFG